IHLKKTVKIKELYNEEIVEGSTLAIPYVVVEEVRNKFANTLWLLHWETYCFLSCREVCEEYMGKIWPSTCYDAKCNEEAKNKISKGGNEEAQSKDHGSLWEKFRASKEASFSKSKSTSSDPISSNADYDFGNPDSDEDEVFEPDDTSYMSLFGGGNQIEDDFSDGYEAHVYDFPRQLDAFCDQFDIFLKVMVESRQFVSWWHQPVLMIMELYNEEIVEGSTLAIPYVAVEEVRNKFANTLWLLHWETYCFLFCGEVCEEYMGKIWPSTCYDAKWFLLFLILFSGGNGKGFRKWAVAYPFDSVNA
nr:hypothetical protein [Tanacetum cinerariifolium]